jgi:hypothetical protein
MPFITSVTQLQSSMSLQLQHADINEGQPAEEYERHYVTVDTKAQNIARYDASV